MKLKLFLIPAILFIASTSFAQEQGAIRFGGGLAYGSKAGIDTDFETVGKIGWNIGAEYFIADQFSLNVGYTQFAKSTINFGTDLDVWLNAIDVDLKYYFPNENENSMFYVLIGYSAVKAVIEAQGNKESEGENAFNAGLGAIFQVSDKVGINLLGKWHKLPEEGQFVANAGLSFRLN